MEIKEIFEYVKNHGVFIDWFDDEYITAFDEDKEKVIKVHDYLISHKVCVSEVSEIFEKWEILIDPYFVG